MRAGEAGIVATIVPEKLFPMDLQREYESSSFEPFLKMIAVPQAAKRYTLLIQSLDYGHIRSSFNLSKSFFILFHEPYLLRAQCVHKLRKMGRDERLNLSSGSFGVSTKFTSELLNQPMIESVLRFLDTDKCRRFRIFKKQ